MKGGGGGGAGEYLNGRCEKEGGWSLLKGGG